MTTSWYKTKEQSAGYYRIYFLYLTYKLFGSKFLKIMMFLVMLFIFPFAATAKQASKKYLEIVFDTNKVSFIHIFRHMLSFAHSLVDKMDAFAGNFNPDNILLHEQNLLKRLDEKKGIFFLCSHLGNIEILRILLLKWEDLVVNIFHQEEQTRIFSNFIKSISQEDRINIFSVSDIDISTSIEISDRLNRGEIVFMAGDRVAAANPDLIFKHKFLGHDAGFPTGVFKFAQMMEHPIYFITCTRQKGDEYIVSIKEHVKKNNRHENLRSMQEEYISFLESMVKSNPYQWYNFFDFWG